MDEPPAVTAAAAPALDPAGRPPRQPGWGVAAAWVGIVAVVVTILVAGAAERRRQAGEPEGISFQLELTGKLAVGMDSWMPGYEAMWLGQVDQMPLSPRERLCRIVLVGELLGHQRALESLQERSGSDEEAVEAAAAVLGALYGDLAEDRGTLPSLDDERRALLDDELGWFGQLARHAPGTADQQGRRQLLRPLARIPLVLMAVLAWLVLCGLAGTTLLIVLTVLAMMRRLRDGFGRPSGAGRIYGETFALWFAGFFIMQAAVGLLAPPDTALPLSVVAFGVSLGALAWPVLRGVPWRQVRRDVGLNLGHHPLVEPLVGGLTYAMAVPLLLAGVVVFWVLMLIQEALFPGSGPPSHPVQEALAQADWTTIVMVFVLGCVAAPLVEEIMFRGVLYRHLRDASSRAGLVASILVSALGSSFLFAIIHPQGWAFSPVLTGLAVAFCLAREWRGTLVPCMVAHAITNALALTLNVMLFRNL